MAYSPVLAPFLNQYVVDGACVRISYGAARWLGENRYQPSEKTAHLGVAETLHPDLLLHRCGRWIAFMKTSEA